MGSVRALTWADDHQAKGQKEFALTLDVIVVHRMG